jgi:RimJ/RimL family protein N-acetyltransferase
VSSVLEGEGVTLRRAGPDDLDFLAGLAGHEEVEPFLAAVSAFGDPDELRAEVERSEEDPRHHGRFVIEQEGRAVGAMAFDVENRRSRIAYLHGIMLDPSVRGRGLADAAARALIRHLVFDLDYHRVQLEVYGFNERAVRHVERVGFVKEGVRRKAYWRHGEWVDGILYGLVKEDLEA